MTPKEYLGQYRRCCRKYTGILESIEQLRSLAEKTTQALTGDRVSGSSSDRLGNIGSILADMKTDIESELKDLANKKKAVEQVIENTMLVCNCRKNCICADMRDVLVYRYILQWKWENIAVELAFDYSWILDLHGKGLQKIIVIDNNLQ